MNDSPVIANLLMDRMREAGILSEKQLAEFRSEKAVEWAKWSDRELAVLLFPNITRTFGESYEAFGYVMDVPHFSIAEKWSNQLVGAFAMWMAQGKIKKKSKSNKSSLEQRFQTFPASEMAPTVKVCDCVCRFV